MFPLLERHAANPVELFQIWLNLPARQQDGRARTSRCCGATAFPSTCSPTRTGRTTRVVTVAGALGGADAARRRRPNSWASRAGHRRRDLDDHAGARRALDAAAGRARAAAARSTSFRRRQPARRRSGTARPHAGLAVRGRRATATLENGADESELLLLQGRPIGEPVAQHGPVRDEHARTRSSRRSPTTGARSSAAGRGRATGRCTRATQGRFALHADGRREQPE